MTMTSYLPRKILSNSQHNGASSSITNTLFMFQSIIKIPTTHPTAINCDANRELKTRPVAGKKDD
jgi:hypothetical protein